MKEFLYAVDLVLVRNNWKAVQTIQFFKSSFVSVNGGRKHFVFLESSYTPTRHFVPPVTSSLFRAICSICSYTSLLRVITAHPRPLLPATSKSNTLFNASVFSVLQTCPHHCTPFVLASPSKISTKPCKFISFLLTPFLN